MIVFIRLKHLNRICSFSLKNNSSYLSFWFIRIKHIRPYQAHYHRSTKFFTMFRHTSETIVEFRCVTISIIKKVLINSLESCWLGWGITEIGSGESELYLGQCGLCRAIKKWSNFEAWATCLIYSIAGRIHISSFDLGQWLPKKPPKEHSYVTVLLTEQV
jgi:hypothetical protein